DPAGQRLAEALRQPAQQAAEEGNQDEPGKRHGCGSLRVQIMTMPSTTAAPPTMDRAYQRVCPVWARVARRLPCWAAQVTAPKLWLIGSRPSRRHSHR